MQHAGQVIDPSRSVATWAALAGRPKTMVSKNLAEILQDHVMLEWKGIDRMYLNGYMPSLQIEGEFEDDEGYYLSARRRRRRACFAPKGAPTRSA